MSSNFNLMLHCGGRRVGWDDIVNVDTPEVDKNTGWTPVSHQISYERAVKALESDDWQIKDVVHSLWREGRVYAALARVAHPYLPPVKGQCDVLAIRNSHDQSIAYGVAFGQGVFVCDNLSFHGEVTIKRKHTRWIHRDLPKLVPQAVGELRDKRGDMIRLIEGLKRTTVTDTQAHDLCVRCLDAGVLCASKMPAVLEHYREPEHEEFQPRTLWSLQNAYTEVFKYLTNPNELIRRCHRLHGVFEGSIAA